MGTMTTVEDTRRAQHATHDVHRATHNMQRATCNKTTCNVFQCCCVWQIPQTHTALRSRAPQSFASAWAKAGLYVGQSRALRGPRPGSARAQAGLCMRCTLNPFAVAPTRCTNGSRNGLCSALHEKAAPDQLILCVCLQFYHRGEFLIVDESARAHLEIVRASKGGRAGVAPGEGM